MANIVTGSAQAQGALWSASPRDWAQIEEPKMAPLFRDVLDALALTRGATLFDAGCGAGLMAAEAARRGAVVTGLDASAAMLEVARERVRDGRFDVGDIEQLPYEDATFDATMAINSIFYCTDMRAGMAELARVTRPGGRVAITAWGRPEQCQMASVFTAVIATLPARPPGGGPFALSAPGALDELMVGAGLRPSSRGESRCVFRSPSWDEAWRGMRSAGPFQGAVRIAGAAAVEAAVRAAIEPFTDADGAIELVNTFAWVLAEKA